MKPLYKSTKVIYDAHLHQFDVYYRNWFFWHFDSCYKFDADPKYVTYSRTEEQAKECAIKRASDMLGTAEVWKQSQVQYP